MTVVSLGSNYLGVLFIDKRINVALTRCRTSLITIFNHDCNTGSQECKQKHLGPNQCGGADH